MKPFIIYSLFAPAALMAQERPNILYIMTDQQTAKYPLYYDRPADRYGNELCRK